MGEKDLVAASTTDTEEQVKAALGVVDEKTEKPEEQVEEKVDEKKVEEKVDEKKVEEKVDEKPALPKGAVGEASLEAEEPKSWAKLTSKELAQKRIDRLTWEREEGRRQRADSEARLQKQIDDLNAKLAGKTDEKKDEKKADAEPKEEDFATMGDYFRALARFEAQKAAREAAKKEVDTVKQETAQSAAEQARAEAVDTFRGRVVDYKKEVDDFDVVISNPNVQVSGAIEAAILLSERGPAIQYYLGKNPAEAAELTAATLMLGAESVPLVRRLLESKLPAPTEKPGARAARKTEEEVPEPITPVGGRQTGSSKSLAEMDQREYNETRNRQERERLKGRK